MKVAIPFLEGEGRGLETSEELETLGKAPLPLNDRLYQGWSNVH